MYTDLGRPGDTFAVPGDRAIYFGFSLFLNEETVCGIYFVVENDVI